LTYVPEFAEADGMATTATSAATAKPLHSWPFNVS